MKQAIIVGKHCHLLSCSFKAQKIGSFLDLSLELLSYQTLRSAPVPLPHSPPVVVRFQLQEVHIKTGDLNERW